jgi:PEP-CTERM motif-containing protein
VVVETGSYQRLIQGFVNVDVRSDVPEPDNMALLGLGLAGLGFSRRKQ